MTDDRRPTTDDRPLGDKEHIPTTISLSPCLRVPLSCSSAVVSGQWSLVVIGYGNDLRGDDAVGQRAAEAVAAWEVPRVRALAVHQLTPELAATLAAVERAIFVDACSAAQAEEVETRLIGPAAVDAPIGHTGDPRALLALTESLYGRSPCAWSITIPAASFAFGANLSPVAQRGLAAALQQIHDLVIATGVGKGGVGEAPTEKPTHFPNHLGMLYQLSVVSTDD